MINISSEREIPIKMMTIREIAKTGLLPEHAIRMMVKQNKIPVLYIGRKALINYNYMVEFIRIASTTKAV